MQEFVDNSIRDTYISAQGAYFHILRIKTLLEHRGRAGWRWECWNIRTLKHYTRDQGISAQYSYGLIIAAPLQL